MYNIDNSKINKQGFIPKQYREELQGADQVLCYIKAWDRSNGFKYCLGFGQVRSRLVANFIVKVLGLPLPKLEEQMNLVYDNFKQFKKHINFHHRNGTLNDWC